MKHDELLAKMAATPIDLKGTVIMYEALVAVVELHKPKLDDSGRSVCSQCTINLSWKIYPCPTIQAVEKEFN